MLTKEVSSYIDIAKNTLVFSNEELAVLGELLNDVAADREYLLIDDLDADGTIRGFAIIGRTPMTKFAWDIYWLITNPNCQRRGVGSSLLKRIEEYVLSQDLCAILRVETSSLPDYEPARKFYLKNEFKISGLIEDFYSQDNDLLIYSKRLQR